MSTHSLDGREWAKLSELSPGDIVEVDNGFDCIEPNPKVKVRSDKDGLYFTCEYGQHYLDDQLSEVDDDHLVGIWPVAKPGDKG